MKNANWGIPGAVLLFALIYAVAMGIAFAESPPAFDRDRVPKQIADGWRLSSPGSGATPSLSSASYPIAKPAAREQRWNGVDPFDHPGRLVIF